MIENNLTGNWHYPTEVDFKSGSIAQLAARLESFSYQNLLCVIDEFLCTQLDIINAIESIRNQSKQVTLFSAFKGNPSNEHIYQGTQLYEQNNCDLVLAIGGGSALDVGKTIAALAHQNCDIWDLIDEGDNYLCLDSQRIPPIIAVPTTAGTGAEVGRATLITNAQTHEKKILFHPKMLPRLVVCDPELTLTLPPALTAATGMDALAHNLEALCAPGYHPLADGIALEGLRLIHENLLIAYQDGNNLNARAHMMSASLMGATAFQKGLGAVHSLSHPVGGEFNAHHGLLNAIFMPYVLCYNRDHIQRPMQRLARHLQLGEHSVDGVLHWVMQLNSTMAITNNLKTIGIDAQRIPALAQRALEDPSSTTNPRPLTLDHCITLLQAAYEGDLAMAQSI